MSDELDSRFNDSCVNNQSEGSKLKITINGRSPLDAFAMLHLERCAHRETRKELNQLRKKYEMLRDEFDSGEGLSQTASTIFSRFNSCSEEVSLLFAGIITVSSFLPGPPALIRSHSYEYNSNINPSKFYLLTYSKFLKCHQAKALEIK